MTTKCAFHSDTTIALPSHKTIIIIRLPFFDMKIQPVAVFYILYSHRLYTVNMKSTTNERILSMPARLKQLRKDNNLTQRQLAFQVGITYQSYQAYEYGTALPSVYIIIDLAELYDVSTDYILGLSEI